MREAEAHRNPFHEPLCSICEDTGRVRDGRNWHGSSGCPRCSDPSDRKRMWTDRAKANPPEIAEGDLTLDESRLFKLWREAGHHPLECLRWIEGQRLQPEADIDTIRETRRRLNLWRLEMEGLAAKIGRDLSWGPLPTVQEPKERKAVPA